jgi:ketosteroid isomerase-like protein
MPTERSRELEQLTRELYAAVSNADATFFEKYLSKSQTCVVIGTAPHEWWDNYQNALEAIRAQANVVGSAMDLVAGEVRGYCEGNVGWVADQPTIRLGAVEVKCRHTSVFVQQDGKWQIVQHHFSMGVPNEDAFGTEAEKLG